MVKVSNSIQTESIRSDANILIIATGLLFVFGIVIAVVTEVLKGPELIANISLAIATSCGPVTIVTLFLKYGFEQVLFAAAQDSLKKAISQEKNDLDEIKDALKVQQNNCKKNAENLLDKMKTLSVLDRCGIVDAFERRSEAHGIIKEWLKNKNNKNFMFVGTSFRGLFWQKEGDPEILDLIVDRYKELENDTDKKGEPFIKFMFTHPAFAYLREKAEDEEREDREFHIREEILRSVLILRERGIPSRCIKFFKGTPTMFGVFTDEAMFLNPYPYKKQSYTSFGLIIKKTQFEDEKLTLYTTFRLSQFEGAWLDNENTVKWADDRFEEFWNSNLMAISPDNYTRRIEPDLTERLKKLNNINNNLNC